MPLVSVACGQSSLASAYVIHHLAQRWSEQGIRTGFGLCYDELADACVLHVDKTRLGGEDVPSPPRDCNVINGRVLDISKRLHSTLLVRPHDEWDGPVIVKTDLNHYGLPESRSLQQQPDPQPQQTAASTCQSWQQSRQLPDRHYPVVGSVDEVPSWVWHDPAYVVERFMPEREGDLYCVRGWMFLGSFSYGWRLLATDHMVKTANVVKYDFTDEVPTELLELKRSTGFDFGKFDYVMHDGKAVVLDLNKTPSYAGDPASPRLKHLARGIEEFLP